MKNEQGKDQWVWVVVQDPGEKEQFLGQHNEQEDIIIKKLNSVKDNVISLNENEIKIILAWSDSTLGIHTMEEESVLKKLKSLLEQ